MIIRKTHSTIAGLSTFFILIAIGVLSIFWQLVLLNGETDSDAFNLLAISAIGQSIWLLIAVIIARWLSNLLITKFNWNKFLAILVAIIIPTGLGAVISFLLIFIPTLLAELQ